MRVSPTTRTDTVRYLRKGLCVTMWPTASGHLGESARCCDQEQNHYQEWCAGTCSHLSERKDNICSTGRSFSSSSRSLRRCSALRESPQEPLRSRRYFSSSSWCCS